MRIGSIYILKSHLAETLEDARVLEMEHDRLGYICDGDNNVDARLD
jgi:hypothetical protein